MKIPFVDLYAQYLSIKPEIDTAIENVIKNSSYIGGSAIKDFEKSFGEYIGIDHVVGCANGTDSIEILLQAFDIGEGDEVIVPAASWISTSEAVSAVGATPIFVDIEADYFTIDVRLISQAITAKTRAIIPVHLYGHPADMIAIMELAKKHNLIVIEDCAQAHGASINGQNVGTFGDASSFSFYPGKNLGAYGDAGCMATNNASIAARARMIAAHGQQGKHNHIIEGRNSRLDGLQAAILSVKLPYLKGWTEARKEHAILYTALLENKIMSIPKIKEHYKHVFHLYVIRTHERDEVKKYLAVAGIETAIHYPQALPYLKCYDNLGYTSLDFPIAFLLQNQILSIPMYAELGAEKINYISETIINALSANK